MYTNIGDVVLDPFVGSGTTTLAAKMTQRHYIGYDISPEYCALAEERVAALDQKSAHEARITRRRATDKKSK